MTDLPVLGAAMMLADYETHRTLMTELPRDLELQDFIFPDVLGGDWRGIADAAVKTLDGHEGRLGIHGPFFGFAIDTMDPEIRAIVTKRLLQGLEVCEVLGATHMVVHSPYTTWNHNNLDNDGNGRDRMIDLCHLTLDQVVKRAEDIGCELVIENVEDKDPLDRVRLADSFNSKSVAVSIDTGHAHYAHGSTGAPPVDYYVKAAGNRLRHVHLQDADGYADRHWPLGEGTIGWQSVFEALRSLTSNPRLIIELRDNSGLPASIGYLNALGLAR